MFQATQKIYDALSASEGFKVYTEERPEGSEAWLQFPVKNGGAYRIRFISRDDDNDVAVRVYSLLSLDEEQSARILPVINKLNNDYRYVKFVLDKDNDVNIEYDYPMACSNPAESVREIVIRIVKIIDDTYPELMRAMWA